MDKEGQDKRQSLVEAVWIDKNNSAILKSQGDKETRLTIVDLKSFIAANTKLL